MSNKVDMQEKRQIILRIIFRLGENNELKHL